MTEKENYMRAVRGEDHGWVPYFRDACDWLFPSWYFDTDPETGKDFYGIEWVTNEYGRMPKHDDPAMKDVAQWRELIRFPDLDAIDWDEEARRVVGASDPNKARMAMINTDGIFLTLINMMGWVDGLCAIKAREAEVMAFNEAITDFFVRLAEYEVEYFQPDILCTGDDLAAANGPFISPKTFAKVYKPYYARLTKVAADAGLPLEFHCCGQCGYLIDEFLDMGSDVIQLAIPTDQLKAQKKEYGRKFVLNGGWFRQGPGGAPGAEEAVVRQSVRDAIDDYAIDGGFIFWDGDLVGQSEDMKRKIAWVADEVHTYGKKVYQ